ncbi:MAG TPA: hypothetical protein VNR88_00105 [Hyphomicrobium sp.]|nr:hypothetical protein [Hyphomicrobium sp.]
MIASILDRRIALFGCLAAGALNLTRMSALAQDAKMITSANELPWKHAADAVACNFALGHLVGNLPRRLTINGRIHAETYISAVGAIAGFAAQRTLFAGNPPIVGVNINRVGTASGEQFWFGDALNYMLVPQTNAEGNRCVWSLALGGALGAGMQQAPKLDAMFKYVASAIGGPNEGTSSVPANHQAQLPARDLLQAVWPVAVMCFSGKFPGAAREYGAAPVAWWSAIAAQASSRPVQDVRSALPPDIALTLLMETAIYCSKLDQTKVERS